MNIHNLFLTADHALSDSGAVANHTYKAGPISVRENELTIELRDLLKLDLERLLRSTRLNIISDNDSESLSLVLAKLDRN